MNLYPFNQFLHRRPAGAIKTGQPFSVTFPVSASVSAKSVDMFFRLQDTDSFEKKHLNYVKSQDGYDVFEYNGCFDKAGIYFYRFEVTFPDGIYFIGSDEFGSALQGDWLKEWQLTVTESTFENVSKLHGGVVYHIFVDRFNREGDTPFIKNGKLKEWNEKLDVHIEGKDYQANDYYGGNIQGIIAKLDYIKSLGATAIYLSPIFEAFSNHRYDIADYSRIDELLGTESDFDQLIIEAKKRGIGIILDGVFNHTGWDSIYFNRFNRYSEPGAYQKKGKYSDWFTFRDDGTYECWWGMTCVPTLNKKSASVRKYFTAKDGVIAKWTKRGILGWRLDVVDELDTDFLELVCGAIRGTNADAVVIGEVWEDASTKHSYGTWRPYFVKHELDGVMNYVYKNAILNYCKGGDSSAFYRDIATLVNNYPENCLKNSFTLLDSHDTVRALTELSGVSSVGLTEEQKRDYELGSVQLEAAVSALKLASAIQYTLSGVPTVYYGDEIGMQGFSDPLNRKTFDWEGGNKEVLSHYKKLGFIRNEYAEYFKGHFFPILDRDLIVYYWQKSESEFTPFDLSMLWSDANVPDRLYFIAYNGNKRLSVDIKGVDLYSGKKVDGCKTFNKNDFIILLRQNEKTEDIK